MTDTDQGAPSDAELVAFLDGELPPDERLRIAASIADDQLLQQRLIVLASGNRPFRQAFQPLLDQAPRDKLTTMLSALSPPKSADVSPTLWSSIGRWQGALAACVLLFLLGFAAGAVLPDAFRHPSASHLAEAVSEQDEWRQAVAEYLTFYTTETLANIPDNAETREKEIASVANKTGLALSPRSVDLAGLSFKRAQLLQYDGLALGQLTYLDPSLGPVALCIIADGSPDTQARAEQREGFNIVFWSHDSHSFMLIGHIATEQLERLASDFAKRLS